MIKYRTKKILDLQITRFIVSKSTTVNEEGPSERKIREPQKGKDTTFDIPDYGVQFQESFLIVLIINKRPLNQPSA